MATFFRDKRQPKDPFTLSADWNFKGKSKSDDREREGQGGGGPGNALIIQKDTRGHRK